MPSIPLRDLLPDEALAEITLLMRQGRCGADNLMQVTRRYHDELRAKGVDSDYLAYAIALRIVQARADAAERSVLRQ
jgi:hypothetical protein